MTYSCGITKFVKHVHTQSVQDIKKGKRKVQGVSQSQTAVHPSYQEEQETDKTKPAQIKQAHKETP